MNAYYFSTRTRAFNNIFYWISQIIGAGGFGAFLDWTRFSRRTRALIGWGILFTLVMVIWGGGYKFLLLTNRKVKSPEMDLFDNHYFWYLLVRSFFPVVPWMRINCLYSSSTWLMASLTRSGRSFVTIRWEPCPMMHVNWPTMLVSINQSKQWVRQQYQNWTR